MKSDNTEKPDLERFRFVCKDCDKERKVESGEGSKFPICDCCGKEMRLQRRHIGVNENGREYDLGWDDI
jgi:transposase-like protein